MSESPQWNARTINYGNISFWCNLLLRGWGSSTRNSLQAFEIWPVIKMVPAKLGFHQQSGVLEGWSAWNVPKFTNLFSIIAACSGRRGHGCWTVVSPWWAGEGQGLRQRCLSTFMRSWWPQFLQPRCFAVCPSRLFWDWSDGQSHPKAGQAPSPFTLGSAGSSSCPLVQGCGAAQKLLWCL